MQNLKNKQIAKAEKDFKENLKDTSKYAQKLFANKQNPVTGNLKGTITLVEFFDYQCSHCRIMTTVIEKIVANNPEIRVIHKEFPIFGSESEFAAKAALAANKQGKYWDLHKALMTSKKRLTNEEVLKLAKSSGLNIKKLQQDMESDAITKELKDNYNLAQTLKLAGTPAFFVSYTDVSKIKSGKDIGVLPGQGSQDKMQKLIDNLK